MVSTVDTARSFGGCMSLCVCGFPLDALALSHGPMTCLSGYFATLKLRCECERELLFVSICPVLTIYCALAKAHGASSNGV